MLFVGKEGLDWTGLGWLAGRASKVFKMKKKKSSLPSRHVCINIRKLRTQQRTPSIYYSSARRRRDHERRKKRTKNRKKKNPRTSSYGGGSIPLVVREQRFLLQQRCVTSRFLTSPSTWKPILQAPGRKLICCRIFSSQSVVTPFHRISLVERTAHGAQKKKSEKRTRGM